MNRETKTQLENILIKIITTTGSQCWIESFDQDRFPFLNLASYEFNIYIQRDILWYEWLIMISKIPYIYIREIKTCKIYDKNCYVLNCVEIDENNNKEWKEYYSKL